VLISCSSTLVDGVPVNKEEAPAATDDARTAINTITRIFLVAITISNSDTSIFLMLVVIDGLFYELYMESG
jgi:hypothetical protein